MRSAADLVRSASRLASLPSIYLRLADITNSPHSGATDVARVIQEDTALAARLLRLVNSAFYGFPSRIDTVSQAISLVGTNQVMELALASSVLRAFEGIPRERVDMAAFWRHSIACALAARAIAQKRQIANAERLFVAGLLHDVGRLLLFLEEPAAMVAVLDESVAQDVFVRDRERAAFGFDHAEVGRELLAAWKLPQALQDAVGRHHSPGLEAATGQTEAATVHVADIIATALALGTSGEQTVAPMDPDAWARLRLEPADIGFVSAEVERQHANVVQIMLVYDHWAEGVGAHA